MSFPETFPKPQLGKFEHIIEGISQVSSSVPAYAPDFVAELQKDPINGFGVAIAIFNEYGYLLFAEHKVTSNNDRTSWGPVSETVKGSATAIESPLMTAGRGIREELGVEPNVLGLRQLGPSVTTLSIWPRFSRRQRILAITVPLMLPVESEHLMPYNPDTPEIGQTLFADPANFENSGFKLREGASKWLEHLAMIGMFSPDTSIGNTVYFPDSTVANADMVDLDETRPQLALPPGSSE